MLGKDDLVISQCRLLGNTHLFRISLIISPKLQSLQLSMEVAINVYTIVKYISLLLPHGALSLF